MPERIEISGAHELNVILGRLSRQQLDAVLKKAARKVGEQARAYISPYPAQPAPANPDRWYKRGWGSQYRRKDGTVGGQKSSEQLGQRWAVRTQGRGAIVGNTASYAAFVHSAEKQASVHDRSGWKTDKETIEHIGNTGMVEQFVVAEIESLL